MNTKKAVMIGLVIGSLAGGYIPELYGGSLFSYGGVLWSGVGSILGILLAYYLTNR